MGYPVLKVAAPRKEAWDTADPSSRIVLCQKSRMHPENPDYGMPAGEIAISEGEGVEGDPGKRPAPWLVGPTPEINALLRAGRLVEVKANTDTTELQLKPEDLANIDGLGTRIRNQLERRGVTDVPTLVKTLSTKDAPEDWLASLPGVTKTTAADIVAQLHARGEL